ncbi:DNA methyltransferase [Bacillus safensis]|nr:DNA adenine methylase [Bacillus safensis]OBW51399.1 DNA methyltransferase [Bacillus safensis]
MPNILSPLRYPGGKSQMSKFVNNLLDINSIDNTIYVEPFAGGAGIAIDLLLKNKVAHIVINDYDRAIYAIWYSILFHTSEFIERILETPINMVEWERQKLIYQNKEAYDLLDLGFATFFLNRTNTSGIITGGPIGGKQQLSQYKLDCRFNKVALIKKISNISKRRNDISLYNFDAKLFIKYVIKELNRSNTFIFFDPPYYKQGKNLYTNFFKHEDHKELAQEIMMLHDFHWITTYDLEENILDIYKSFPKKIYTLQYSARNSRKESEYLFHNNKTVVTNYDKVVFEKIPINC